MAAFDFKLVHRPRRLNLVDRPSRRPDFIEGSGTEAILLLTLENKLRASRIGVLIGAAVH